jgi:hypothetical protein
MRPVLSRINPFCAAHELYFLGQGSVFLCAYFFSLKWDKNNHFGLVYADPCVTHRKCHKRILLVKKRILFNF